jgi:hypothetical protein
MRPKFPQENLEQAVKKLQTLRCALFGIVSLLATGASAQEAPTAAPGKNQAEPAQAVVAMEDPRPGDHWTYEIRDEITGKITATRENIVTEVKPTSISVRFDKLGANTNAQGFTIYDRSWNVVEALPWRFSPHDGTGIQAPLEVGKTWPVQTNNINGANGSVWKRSGTSKVVGQESIATKAGTFDTFKIETKFTGSDTKNPTVKNEVTSLTWYAPAIDHWVRRTFVSSTDKHLRVNNVIELISYGRKQ